MPRTPVLTLGKNLYHLSAATPYLSTMVIQWPCCDIFILNIMPNIRQRKMDDLWMSKEVRYQARTWLWQTAFASSRLHYGWGLFLRMELVNLLNHHLVKTSGLLAVSYRLVRAYTKALLSWGLLISLWLTPKMLTSKGCFGEGLRYLRDPPALSSCCLESGEPSKSEAKPVRGGDLCSLQLSHSCKVPSEVNWKYLQPRHTHFFTYHFLTMTISTPSHSFTSHRRRQDNVFLFSP